MDRAQWTDIKDRLLMQVRRKNPQPVTLEEVNTVCHFAREAFNSQAPLLEIEPPVNICGDIHGQFDDLIRLFNNGHYPPTARYLFLGDYVDRGPMSIEVILLLMLYKIRFPNHMFLLRGNHEFDNINNIYGFYMEVMNRYHNVKMWKLFNQTFMYMPLAALVGGRILCMHGGISMELNNFDQIRTIRRPMKVPYSNLTCDLVWADPCKTIVGWQRNIRGASYMFGENVVHQFCQVMDIDMIARAHQVVPKGYEFFANNKLVTLFSAPNYCGEYDNDAAMMHVNRDMHCDIKQFRGHRRRTR